MNPEHYAWLLADELGERIAEPCRTRVFCQLGAGDTWQAIATMLQMAVDKDWSITKGLHMQLITWLAAYVGNLDEPQVRVLLGQVRVCKQGPE